MADIWPSTPDTSAAEESSPRVVGLDDEDADELLSAISSETARELLAELHEEPATPSSLADRVDTTLQNVQYHIENLREADMVEVIDTIYSEKGREMKVYAAADRPLVMFASPEHERPGLKDAILRLLGSVGILAVVSLLVQAWLGDLSALLPGGLGSEPASGADAGGDPGTMTTESAESVAAAEQAAGLPPGMLFFLGGAVVLCVGFAVWYLRRR
ncbi:MAG: ArsR/SmtB family transcription factor [Haloferacaceae archaeon]